MNNINSYNLNMALQTHDQATAIALLGDPHIKTSLNATEILQLQYVRMHSLSVTVLLQLLNKSMLVAYSVPEFNLYQEVVAYQEQMNFSTEEIDLIKGVLDVLKHNQEKLGNQNIVMANKTTVPTISHWLLDYDNFRGSNERTALDQMKYLNNASNIKILTKEQNLILQNLIQLYDYCNRFLDLWQLIPDDADPVELSKLFTPRDFLAPIIGSKEFYDTDFTDHPAPLADVIGGGNVSKSLEPVINKPPKSFNNQPKDTVASKPLQPTVPVKDQLSAEPDFHIRLSKDLDLKPQPKKGLVFDQSTNVDMTEELRLRQERSLQEQARLELAKKQADIQIKLQELKKRQVNDKNKINQGGSHD
jgi:hypothetical protein